MGIINSLRGHLYGFLFVITSLIVFNTHAVAAVGDYGSLPVTVKIESDSKQTQTSVPVTFGHVFSPGHVPAGQTLQASYNGSAIPLQVDAKATHADGSLRHAVLTLELPSLDANQTQDIALSLSNSPISGNAVSSADLLAAKFAGQPFDAVISVNLGGEVYQASARDILSSTASPKLWLQGPLASEWLLSAPLKKADGTEHPHLTARFNVRAFRGLNHVKVDVILENNWAFVPNPETLVYDLTVTLAGQVQMQRTAQSHWHHARWVETFWLGGQPALYVRHDNAYLLATHALPNYDTSIVPLNIGDEWNADPADVDIMKIPRFTSSSMGNTGAQPGIGPLPKWAAEYLISMNANTKRTTIGMSQRAGSWSIHYRDKATDLPISIRDALNGSVTIRSANAVAQGRSGDKKLETCSTVCDKAGSWDVAHVPEFSYLPYLVTGDYYHLEELQFWADFALLYQAPGYREFERGLMRSDQIRGQGWGLRTIANAAYITPDQSPLKAAFNAILHENFLWYEDNYLKAGAVYANNLGVTMSQTDNTGTQTWMDDFLTFAVGYISEMGYSEWESFWYFKSKFPLGRIVDDGFCYLNAAPYKMGIGPSKNEFFTSFSELMSDNSGGAGVVFPDNYTVDPSKCPVPDGVTTHIQGEAAKTDATGYAAYMQPGMTVAVDSAFNQNDPAAQDKAKEAWRRFRLGTAAQLYDHEPQFALVPRSVSSASIPLVVTIWADNTSIVRGASATIFWNANSGAVCTGSGDWSLNNLGNSGSHSVSPLQSSSYSISCQISGSNAVSANVEVTVTDPPPVPNPGAGTGTGTGSGTGTGTGTGTGAGNSNGGNGSGNSNSGGKQPDLGQEAGGSLTPWLFALILVLAGRELSKR